MISSVKGINAATCLVAKAAAPMISNPRLTAFVMGILTSNYWMPKAEAGPIAFHLCQNACMAGLSVALPTGVTIMFPAPTYIACNAACAPFLAPAFP